MLNQIVWCLTSDNEIMMGKNKNLQKGNCKLKGWNLYNTLYMKLPMGVMQVSFDTCEKAYRTDKIIFSMLLSCINYDKTCMK